MELPRAIQSGIERYHGLSYDDLCGDRLGALLAQRRAQLTELERDTSQTPAAGAGQPAPGGRSVAMDTASINYGAEHDEREKRICELREEIAHLERLSEFVQIVLALVHEVSQPITAISNYTSACRRLLLLGQHEPIESGLRQIADQTDRARLIVQRLREFVR